MCASRHCCAPIQLVIERKMTRGGLSIGVCARRQEHEIVRTFGSTLVRLSESTGGDASGRPVRLLEIDWNRNLNLKISRAKSRLFRDF